MRPVVITPSKCSSWRRAKHRLAHSIKLRMVMVFLLLAAAMTFVFVTAAQKAFSLSWREAALPLLMDYVSRLAVEVSPDDNGPPSIERAQAITQRLPVTIAISGPLVNWRSHPDQKQPDWLHDRPDRTTDAAPPSHWGDGQGWETLLRRSTRDGHTLTFGINEDAFQHRPRLVGYALSALLLLTLLAWAYVRRLLKPLDAIGEGARRFGAGDFSQPIAQRGRHAPDELGELATTINTMGNDIRQMLDAKRALLLAISHELRSPLTRARLNTELLPETAEVSPQRDALLRDLLEMASLITDLLESERLAGRHAALQCEPVVLEVLAREVLAELQARHPGAAAVRLQLDPALPTLALDPARMRLLLRNLLDNALRHSAEAAQPPELNLNATGSNTTPGIELTVRDHGPGVPEDQLPRLTEPFFRPDTARTRSQGGVGLGLHLCKLVAQAHGGTLMIRNAQPGLAVTVRLPAAPRATSAGSAPFAA
jgi:signal transduction histidine kinase